MSMLDIVRAAYHIIIMLFMVPVFIKSTFLILNCKHFPQNCFYNNLFAQNCLSVKRCL